MAIVTRNQELINQKQAALKPSNNPAQLAVRRAIASAARKVAPVNSEKRQKILAFRDGFDKYAFATNDELRIFEASIMDKKPVTDAEEFTNWWRNYAALKGWNEHAVLEFIRDYNISRE